MYNNYGILILPRWSTIFPGDPLLHATATSLLKDRSQKGTQQFQMKNIYCNVMMENVFVWDGSVTYSFCCDRQREIRWTGGLGRPRITFEPNLKVLCEKAAYFVGPGGVAPLLVPAQT